MQISKFQKLDVDILLEWVYDDENYLAEDYRVIIDTLTDTRSYSQDEYTGIVKSITNNITSNQLFLIDSNLKKWGIVDSNPTTNRYHFLQFQNYSGNVPFRYDRLRIHFPIDYTFSRKGKTGMLINVKLFNQNQTEKISLCNYYYDETNPLRLSELELHTPFQFQERIWGKYIELLIPSPYALTRDYTISNGVSQPRAGGLQENLLGTNLDLLSLESPIFIDFQYLTKKNNLLNQISYTTSTPFSCTLPLVPEFETLGVKIEHAPSGKDYFIIYGTFNNNISDFNAFMNQSFAQGKRYSLIYEVTQFEKNLQVSTVSYFKTDNFDSPQVHRPIIFHSTTTATLDVVMKLIDSADDSIITRKTQYSMLQDEAAKYGENLTKLNMSSTYKPKVYNAKPDQINFSKSPLSNSVQKVQVPIAIMYSQNNIVTKNTSEQINDTTWYGTGLNQILLHHTDNVIEFTIGKETNSEGVVPFNILESTLVVLQFKSNKQLIEAPLFNESGLVNLSQGKVVFRLTSSQMPTLAQIYKDGFDQFYIVGTDTLTGISTVIYFGRFILSSQF